MRRLGRMRRISRIARRKNEYFKRTFKDGENYYLSYVEKYNDTEKKYFPITTASIHNARNFVLNLKPDIGNTSYQGLLRMYRWVKFNYFTVYVSCTAHQYTGDIDSTGSLQGKIDKGSITAQFRLNTNSTEIQDGMSNNYVYIGWNRDGAYPHPTVETMRDSQHVRAVRINGKRFIKFTFRVPKELRRYVGTDHVAAVDEFTDWNSYLQKCLYGTDSFMYRVPTKLYACAEEIASHLRTNYIGYSDTTGIYREPGIRLSLHYKMYFGCTFKTLVDI